MVWIKGNKVYEIITGKSRKNTIRKVKEYYLSRGYKQIGEVREHGDGYGCLVYKEVKK